MKSALFHHACRGLLVFAAVAIAVPASETIHEAARDVAEAEAIIGHGVRKTPRHQKKKETCYYGGVYLELTKNPTP